MSNAGPSYTWLRCAQSRRPFKARPPLHLLRAGLLGLLSSLLLSAPTLIYKHSMLPSFSFSLCLSFLLKLSYLLARLLLNALASDLSHRSLSGPHGNKFSASLPLPRSSSPVEFSSRRSSARPAGLLCSIDFKETSESYLTRVQSQTQRHISR